MVPPLLQIGAIPRMAAIARSPGGRPQMACGVNAMAGAPIRGRISLSLNGGYVRLARGHA
jgi:hypothetical protein